MKTKEKLAFRLPTIEEVKVCAAHNPEEGKVYLYLYLDARTVMDILDDAVGPLNWDRKHEMLGNKVYCSIGINLNFDSFDRDRIMVWKSDVGTKTPIEKEKGESSDSFKRAAVSWGIARALYSAPDMLLDQSKCILDRDKVLNKYEVASISYSENGRKIKNLVIIDLVTGEIAYEMEDYQEVVRGVQTGSNGSNAEVVYAQQKNQASPQMTYLLMPEAPQGTMMGASPQVEVQRTPQMMPGIIPPLQTASSGNTLAMTETVHPSGQMGIVTSGMENAPVKISTPISEEAQMRKDADIEERKAKIQAILDEKIGYTARKEMTFRQVWKDNRYMDFLLNKFIPTDSGTQAVKDKAIYLIANRKIVDMVI